MGISLDANLPAIRALNNGNTIGRNLDISMERLSSGLKISLAEDDASSMAIADALNHQGMSLKESIKNANDGIGIMQIADQSIGHQIELLGNIRVKAINAATATQSKSSLLALQKDISELSSQIDDIANNTVYNTLPLLSGSFLNKDFHTGIGENDFVRVSIQSTNIANLGKTRFETGAVITASGSLRLELVGVDGKKVVLENSIISSSVGTGVGSLVEIINKSSDILGVKARFSTVSTADKPLGSGLAGNMIIENIVVNGYSIGNIDVGGQFGAQSLIHGINDVSSDTGINASLDIRGHLVLSSLDGRGINVSAGKNAELLHLSNIADDGGHQNYGRLTLSQIFEPRDIVVGGLNSHILGFTKGRVAEETVDLKNIKQNFTIEQSCAMGVYENKNSNQLFLDKTLNLVEPGVLTTHGANAIIDSIDIALNKLENILAGIAATQNVFVEVVDSNLSLKNNLLSAESQLRDTDYAEETTQLQLNQSLMQANIYAISKSHSIRQLILELLQ